MTSTEERKATIDLRGVNRLELVVEDAGDGANGDWGIWFDPQLRRLILDLLSSPCIRSSVH